MRAWLNSEVALRVYRVGLSCLHALQLSCNHSTGQPHLGDRDVDRLGVALVAVLVQGLLTDVDILRGR